MKTKKTSAARSSSLRKPSKRDKGKTTPLGRAIARGMEEAVAWARGELELRTRVIYVPKAVDVAAIREKSGLSQSQFAERYGFSPRTLQDWEQGRRQPDSAVRAYLTVIERNPEAVQTALWGGRQSLES
jgi:putative transcriptional regulator